MSIKDNRLKNSLINVHYSSKDEVGWNGIWSDEHCYFLLKEGSSIAEIERRLPDFYKKHLGEKNDDHAEYHTQALASIHHDERYGNYNYNTTSYEKIAAMSVIGIFLIITACINFINLVTAEATKLPSPRRRGVDEITSA